MAPTPSPRPVSGYQTPLKTPQSKHRLHFPNPRNGAPSPLSAVKEAAVPTEHPVEVIGRIRDYADRKEKTPSALEISDDGRSIRVRSDIGYRDFSLDGVSVSEAEDLEAFYKRFVESRIEGVRLGSKCTIMMYGPTGAGKSHTMFGCSKQPGIVYRALRDILGEGDGEGGADNAGFGLGLFVQVAVLEIYNEEIYDLLSGNPNGGGASVGLPKGSTPKVKLEVMGKKAKNATYISGNEAGKISREVAKVEKRRIVKSTLCNERSSRSHCLIILDVPSVGGRLMLVDMAGSENIDAAGQIGFEAKMQTAKINQGNIALKRVVESIANGDSHVPFRDSKLTMLLQDSFEDDKSKILMILCASPDPKEMHKTISTLEYGAKAKCIVRAAHMPTPRDKNSEESSIPLNSRIMAMNQFIFKLQVDNKAKEKERDEAHKELLQKEQELAELRAKLKLIEGTGLALKEQEIKLKVEERTQLLRLELTKMEEKMLKQQEELNLLRQRLEEVEYERTKVGDGTVSGIGGRFVKRFTEIYSGDQSMVKSMELDMGDQPITNDIKEIKEDLHQPENYGNRSPLTNCSTGEEEEEDEANMFGFPDRVCLSTVYEGDEEGDDQESTKEDEVEKEIVEENIGHVRRVNDFAPLVESENDAGKLHSQNGDLNDAHCQRDALEKQVGLGHSLAENVKDPASARRTRIQNIFRLCGNHRELAQQVKCPFSFKKKSEEDFELEAQPEIRQHLVPDLKVTGCPVSSLLVPLASLHLSDEQKAAESESRCISPEKPQDTKENCRLGDAETDGLMEVYVKWEASKELSGNPIKKLKMMKNSSLSDLRKLIETHLKEENNKLPFTFLLLGEPSGAPVTKEKETMTQVSKLPLCNNQLNCHLACLRPVKKAMQGPNHIPFSSLENTLPAGLKSPHAEGLSPKMRQRNTDYLTGLRV